MSEKHAHAHGATDDVLLASEKGIRALKVSIAGLALTVLFQAGIAILGGSSALLADTLHNFGDIFTAVPLWIAFILSQREATRRYTYGYGRAEDVAGVLIVLMILATAGLAAYESYRKLVTGTPIRLVEWGMVAGIVGFLGNEIVAQYRINVGEEIGSAALVADGQHARVDGLTSLAAFFGLLGVWLGFPWADPLAGFVITLFILYIVYDVGQDILGRLMDAVEPGTIENCQGVAARVGGVRRVHDVRARWLGHELYLEMHVDVDGELSVVEGHRIAEKVRHELLHHVSRLTDVVVHVDPDTDDERDHHTITAHHFR